MFFAGYSGFLHYLQLASHELAIIGINVMKTKIPNPNCGGDVDVVLVAVVVIVVVDVCVICILKM